jgi:hypothetical protein
MTPEEMLKRSASSDRWILGDLEPRRNALLGASTERRWPVALVAAAIVLVSVAVVVGAIQLRIPDNLAPATAPPSPKPSAPTTQLPTPSSSSPVSPKPATVPEACDAAISSSMMELLRDRGLSLTPESDFAATVLERSSAARTPRALQISQFVSDHSIVCQWKGNSELGVMYAVGPIAQIAAEEARAALSESSTAVAVNGIPSYLYLEEGAFPGYGNGGVYVIGDGYWVWGQSTGFELDITTDVLDTIRG